MNNWQLNIAHGASAGLQHDAHILYELLSKAFPFAKIRLYSGGDSKVSNALKLANQISQRHLLRKKQLVIHLEELYTEISPHADKNLFIPNQEWLRSNTRKAITNEVDVVCKTHYALSKLRSFWPHATYCGFTSKDAFKPEVPKSYGRFLHVAGKSEQKGTSALLEAWTRHPEWPVLTVLSRRPEHKIHSAANIEIISDFISDSLLNQLMNECGVHLCPSEAEGFGHSINEAMSSAAAVMVTNAPPMNELCQDAFLVDYTTVSERYSSELFHCSADNIEQSVTKILACSESELSSIGTKCRATYLERHKAFEQKFIELIRDLIK